MLIIHLVCLIRKILDSGILDARSCYRALVEDAKSWVPFQPDMAQAAQVYADRYTEVQDQIQSCSSPEDVSAAFASWAAALEDSVDRALHVSHVADPVQQPHAGLPKSARGGCQYG